MKIVGIIPARYQSSRFPGKPLVRLLGKPMILYVCDTTANALGRENTYVATDSEEIAEVVRANGYNVIMTSPNCLTGTDRIAEAAGQIPGVDFILNVQGDEPLVTSESILKVLRRKIEMPGAIINGMAIVGNHENPASRNMPKVVVTEKHQLLYMSRALLPAYKSADTKLPVVWKQVCIYGFTPEHLRAFSSFGRKSFVENCEDIEILRFLEFGIPIQMVQLPDDSIAVDIPDDVVLVENELNKRLQLTPSRQAKSSVY